MNVKINNQTMKEYLDTGKYHKVLVKFHHGLGDTMMFYAGPYHALRCKYPNVQFFLDTHCGQEKYFGKPSTRDEDYDIVFDISFPCAEWDSGDETKAQKCARLETGVPFAIENCTLPHKVANPLVGVHFISTCIKEVCCPEEFAKKIWEQIAEEGMIPIDTHMKHANANSDTFDFAKRNVQDISAEVGKLFGLLKACNGFIGVSSGNFLSSLYCLQPKHIMYIKTSFAANKLTKIPVWEIDANKPYDRAKVHDFLTYLKEDK